MNEIPKSIAFSKPINAPLNTFAPEEIQRLYGTPRISQPQPTLQNERTIFESHFPKLGKSCLSYDGAKTTQGKPTRSEFFAYWKKFWCRVNTLVAAGHSIFVSPSSFQDTATQRTHEQVEARQNLAVDIDVHPSGTKGNSPCFVSADAALVEVYAIVAATALPMPSMIIRSGAGLHLWWALDKALVPQEWKTLAHAFKSALMTVEPRFGVDTSRWTDISGVLRPPGSVNRKPEFGSAGAQVTLESGHTNPWAVSNATSWAASIVTAPTQLTQPATPMVQTFPVTQVSLLPGLKGARINPVRLASALNALSKNGSAAKIEHGGNWCNILMAIAGAAKVNEIPSHDAENLMRKFSQSDAMAYSGADNGMESEKRIKHILSTATGERSAGSIIKAAKDIGWTDSGEPLPGMAIPQHTNAMLLAAVMERIIMSGGIAQTDELVQIILTTPTVQNGLLAFDTVAGVVRLYADGIWHALPTPDCHGHMALCTALAKLKKEVLLIAYELGLTEETWATTWFDRICDVARLQSGYSDQTEIEPGTGIKVGTVLALAARLGKGAMRNKMGALQRAELSKKRTEFISSDGFQKAWRRIGNQNVVLKNDFGRGMVHQRSAIIVAQDVILRDDGTLGQFDPRYLATTQVEYSFGVPDNQNVKDALASPSGWVPPQSTAKTFFKVLNHVTGGDRDVVKHVLSLIGAKLLRRNTGQKALLFVGAPASGKSLIIKGIEQAVGTAAAGIGKNILAGSQKDETRIASLIKSKPLFLVCSEFQDFSGRTDWGTFKEIVGGDTINARIAYQSGGTDGRFNSLLILASNGLPHLASDVTAVLRRLDVVFVPAHLQMKDEAIDSTFEATILLEAPEIAKLLVQLGGHYNADQSRPLAMVRAVEMIDTSWAPKVRQWLIDNTATDPKGHTSISRLKLNFDQWVAATSGAVGDIKSDELVRHIIDQGVGIFSKERKRDIRDRASSNAVASIVGIRLIDGGFSI